MVRKNSPLKMIEDVDRAGVRIAVATGSAYDLYLTRTIKNATLVRAPTGPEAMAMFMRDRLDAAGGVRQPLVEFAAANPELRVMDGRFMAIQQAMGMPTGRVAASPYLRAFVEEMKASGFCTDALKRSNQPDAMVAPPA
jgi:polar amino acid transport system substrate-binding protein